VFYNTERISNRRKKQMRGLYFLLPVLFTILISFMVVRAAAIALMMTGMDRNRAVFQALSAFTGTGFTTREAERVINNPMRRKIISWLMILGNAGFITVIVTSTSSLVTSKGYSLPLDIMLLILGLILIYKLASSQGFVRRWERFIENKLTKSPAFEEDAVEDLLHLIEGYGLVRAIIRKDSPLIGTTIQGCQACGEKIQVLGIERGNRWIPIPGPQEKLEEGDRVVVYGQHDELRELFKEERTNVSFT
jgi:hypothetical protein